MKKHYIPPELEAIKPPSTTKECLEIATTILKFENPVDKYKVYQAQHFFMNNIKSFSKEEFIQINKNNLFIRKYIGQYSYDILDFCISNEITYPIALHGWFDKNVSLKKQKEYLKLLNKENNQEQIMVFHEHLPHIINHLFFELETLSSTFINIILQKDPENIFKIKSWNDDITCDWLKNNRENSREILHRSLNNRVLNDFPKSKKQLYENIIEEYINITPKIRNSYTKNNFHFSNTFSRYPIDYIQLLEENYPDLWEKQINLKISIIGKEKTTILNGIQMILLNREDSLHNSVKIFSKYKELITNDVKTEVGFYDKTFSFFEYCLSTNNLKPFALFDLKDDLNNEEKEMLVAAAFMYFNGKNNPSPTDIYHSKSNNNNILQNWYTAILKECSDEQFKKYSQKIQETLKDDSQLEKIYSAIELARTLEANSETVISKRPKL